MLRDALNFLVGVDPELPWALLSIAAFYLVYAWRKWAPKSWVAYSRIIPVDDESGWIAKSLQELVQAVPSAVIGGVLPVLLSGGDWRLALKGTLYGLAAPLIHKASKRYKGEVGKGLSTKVAPLSMIALLMLGCSGGRCGPDDAVLNAIIAECSLRRAEACPDATENDVCPGVDEDCDARIDGRCQ
jgi:hypothetical protein